MSKEPGLTLGRVVAIERNALAAIEAAKQMNVRVSQLEAQLETVHAQKLQLEQQIQALNVRIAMMAGNGST